MEGLRSGAFRTFFGIAREPHVDNLRGMKQMQAGGMYMLNSKKAPGTSRGLSLSGGY